MKQTENCLKEYLKYIHSNQDFKGIPQDELPNVADEIRRELVRITSQNGGHLASNLGVVELTMALHRVFDTPKDHIIFDVGHQSYVHKMLTGRYEQMDTIRQAGGLSGFTNRFESEHDCFGAGHSSTSLSAGLGFAISDRLKKSDAYTVVVIGDGAYTGGMIHEALNNCRKDLNLVIILNENEMSISRNIGWFARYLSRLRTKSGYFKTKKATGGFLKKIPLIGSLLFRSIRAIKKGIKSLLYGSNYFENMGLTYLGPIDGNNYDETENLLREAKKLGESVVIHIKTQKGKGFAPAEEAPDIYHGMQPSVTEKKSQKTFSKEMGEYLCKLASDNEQICAITAAMADGTGLTSFKEMHEDRFFDVGIAESHALTFAAGLASNQMHPLVAVYSTFLQRGYDNLIHDIALQQLPVVICVDRAGLNAGDGATHHGIFDVSFLSQIPNMRIYTPITIGALRSAMREAYSMKVPCAIRYPNGCESKDVVQAFYSKEEYGAPGAVCNYDLSEHLDAIIVTHGKIVLEAMQATDLLRKESIHVGIILLEILKPYDQTAERISQLLPKDVACLLFLEEEIRSGGMGMNLADQMNRLSNMNHIQVCVMSVDDSFVEKRSIDQTVYEAAGIDAAHIQKNIKNMLKG